MFKFANNNSSISIPTNASKAPQNISDVQVEPKPPLLQVSVGEASAGGRRWPVKFPLRFTVPQASDPRTPDCEPFHQPTGTVSINNRAQGCSKIHPRYIRPHAQAYHPYARPTQGKGEAVPAGHPPRLRRATTEPAILDQVSVVENATASKSMPQPHRPAGYPVPPTLTGPNSVPVLRRALTAQPGAFASSFTPDQFFPPFLNTHNNAISFGNDVLPSQTPRPLRHEPMVLIGSDREFPANFAPGSQTVPPTSQISCSRNVENGLQRRAPHQAHGQPVLSQGLSYPQMVQALTPSTPTDPQLMSALKNGRLTITGEDSINEDPSQRLGLILVPRILPDRMHSNARDGPEEALYFNQTETGLGTLLPDCINHSHDPTFMFGRGDEGLPLSWVLHLMSSPNPDYLTIEFSWPGYPHLTHRWKAQFRDCVMYPGKTITKMFVARQIALAFCSMYQNIQQNDQKLREGKLVDERYFPEDGRWELGPNWITLDKIKLVSLQWAYGYTFQAQMAVSI